MPDPVATPAATPAATPVARQVQVALFSPPFAELTYSLPPYLAAEEWHEGQRVAVPLGRGLRAGILLSADGQNNEHNSPPDRAEDQTSSDTFTIKPVLWPLERLPLLPDWYREMARQIAVRQGASFGQILAGMLPAALRTTKVRLRSLGPGRPQEFPLSSLLSRRDEELRELGRHWSAGLADFATASSRGTELCLVQSDPPWPVRPSAKAQIALLEYLLARGGVSKKRLISDLGKGAATTLLTLVGRGLVAIRPDTPEHDTPGDNSGPLRQAEPQALIRAEGHAPEAACSAPALPETDVSEPLFLELEKTLALPGSAPFTLTPEQRGICDTLGRELGKNRKGPPHLLFGVTGSGKTAVYLELARKTIALGKSVLLLAPEVALACKLRNDVRETLPDIPHHLFHGSLTPSGREALFRTVAARKDPCIVIGARSALFLPLSNVGLIVLDEEHDGSFKQDEGLHYQAKEIAWYRANTEKALLLLGSATPDVKSYHAVTQGQMPMHILSQRVGGGELPQVRVVPLGHASGKPSLLAAESLSALRATVDRGEQAVILLNRRGYAPLMYCLQCATVAKCPHCDIGLTYHKGRERLVCHYCGHSSPFPVPCALCRGLNYLPMGEGTEKLEETLASTLPPGTGVLRLDRDSTRRPGQMEGILAAFARREAGVLVGTQMLSKGHHFPEVTLAIIADADLGLNMPDYRATERTFQLLVQSAGRSGRGCKPGEVIIQTRNPAHYCWNFVRNADYEGFYATEIALREKRKYPPFVRLALIRISHPLDLDDAAEQVNALGDLLRTWGRELGLTVLGPAPAPLALLKGRKRFHCLVKGQDWAPLRALFHRAYTTAKGGKLRLTLDLDPVNML